MLQTSLKAFQPLFINNLTGCLVVGVILYVGFHEMKYIIFSTMIFLIITFIDFVRVDYNTYFEKSKYKHSSVFIPDSANDTEKVDENMMVEIPILGRQDNQNRNSVFKNLVILAILIFCRYFTSEWKLPFVICLDYILCECYQYCQRICSNNKKWNAAILISLIKFLLKRGIFVLTLRRIIPYIIDEMDNYTRYVRYVLPSEVVTSSLQYRIETYIALNIDKYRLYLVILLHIIAGKFYTQL